MAWIYSSRLMMAYENSLSSPGLAEESSGDISSGGVQFALSSPNPTPAMFSLRVKTMKSCRRFRSGMTSEPLTDSRGEAVLTWCLAASRARTSAVLEMERGSEAPSRDSGRTCLGSFAMFSPDSSSWKTPQGSLLGDSSEFSGTWPRSGSMRSGACWERTTAVPPIAESEYGSWLWPTPTVGDSFSSGSRNLPGSNARPGETLTDVIYKLHGIKRGSRGGQMNPAWTESFLMGWPVGWTDCEPLAMGRFLEWQRQHSKFSGLVADGETHAIDCDMDEDCACGVDWP